MSSPLDAIDTIVLLMLENRSFDHILGHLSMENIVPGVNGLSEPLQQFNNNYQASGYPPFQLANDAKLERDLPHEFNEVAMQLAKNPVNGQYTMRGFVNAYAQEANSIINPECLPMSYFPSGLVPVSSFLAGRYCTCDAWHCPLPTSTQPNRIMAFTGDSPIHNTKLRLINMTGSIFDWLDDASVKWRVYHDGFSFFSLYPNLWGKVLGSNFKRHETLYNDMKLAKNTDDPQVIVIEPCYQSAPNFGRTHPNDNHAPLSMGWGEDFLRRTYQALTVNEERWKKTVFVVYYDEHGGFFDHVPPPAIPYTTTSGDAYSFESLGPRVPGIVISPYTVKSPVSHDLFDHTSVLQLLAEKFTPGKSYSDNVEQRQKAGIQSLSKTFGTTPDFTIVDAPQVQQNFEAALPFISPIPPKDGMSSSFEEAAFQMVKKQKAKAVKKYPEITAWADETSRIRNQNK